MEKNTFPGYDLLYHGAGFAAQEQAAILQLHGKDAADLLHRLSTNAIKEITTGQVIPTFFTNDKGRILDYVHVAAIDNCIFLFGSTGRNELLTRWLQRYIISDDVKVTDKTTSMIRYEVAGPHTAGVMVMLLNEDIRLIPDNTIKRIELEAGIVYVYRLVTPQENRMFICGDAIGLPAVLDDVIGSGKVFEAGIVEAGAYNAYCIENGFATTTELNDSFNPHEVEMLHAVSFKKGCYIGQEVIARLDTYDKVQKKLRMLKLDGPELPKYGEKLFASTGEEAGVITGAVHSPKYKSAVALGFVKKAFAAEGTKLTIRADHKTFPATIKK